MRVFIQELAVMFIIIQVKAQDFASLSMRVSYRETKAGQQEHKTILIKAKGVHPPSGGKE